MNISPLKPIHGVIGLLVVILYLLWSLGKYAYMVYNTPTDNIPKYIYTEFGICVVVILTTIYLTVSLIKNYNLTVRNFTAFNITTYAIILVGIIMLLMTPKYLPGQYLQRKQQHSLAIIPPQPTSRVQMPLATMQPQPTSAIRPPISRVQMPLTTMPPLPTSRVQMPLTTMPPLPTSRVQMPLVTIPPLPTSRVQMPLTTMPPLPTSAIRPPTSPTTTAPQPPTSPTTTAPQPPTSPTTTAPQRVIAPDEESLNAELVYLYRVYNIEPEINKSVRRKLIKLMGLLHPDKCKLYDDKTCLSLYHMLSDVLRAFNAELKSQ